MKRPSCSLPTPVMSPVFSPSHCSAKSRGTGVAALVILWLLGMVSSYTLGGFIHLLLVLAIAVVLINIIQGRRPV